MADNRISSFPIANLLKALGAREGKNKNTYHSPFREDKDASLHIDPDRNVWYDHGAGTGGGNIDLVMKCRGCSAREAAEYILGLPQGGSGGLGSDSEDGSGDVPRGGKSKETNPLTNRILMIRELRAPFLLEYVASRGIPETIAARYCKEVILRGKTFGKTYDHIGFPNNVGGFALKAPSGFKCTTKGGITTIDTAGTFSDRPTSATLTVFEGFFDFLSWLAKDKRVIPTTDVCVLNSVSNLGRSIPYLKAHGTIICCLDNDEAGRAALDSLREQKKILGNPVIIDGSLLFSGYKDINEWWVARNTLK